MAKTKCTEKPTRHEPRLLKLNLMFEKMEQKSTAIKDILLNK